jgi:hypothetical protein
VVFKEMGVRGKVCYTFVVPQSSTTEGQDLSKIKKAKEITNEGVDDNIKFIYGFVPSSVIPVDIKNLSHTCSNCGFEEIIPLILEEGGENNE